MYTLHTVVIANALYSQELGLDVDTVIINVVEGENFKPDFLKLVSA
jgi:glutathione S-transferase